MTTQESKSAVQPATPIDAAAPPPPLWLVVPFAALWWGAIVGHFLACGWCAYVVGDPTYVPGWLAPFDLLFSGGISGLLSLLLMLVWWIIVGILFMPGIAAVFGAAAVFERLGKGRGSPSDAAWQALGVMTPVLVMSLLSLLILPAQAPNHYDGESGLEIANRVSYAAFAELQFLSLFAMLMIFLLFGTIFLGATFMATYLPDGGFWQLFAVIFLGIGVMLAVGMTAGPVVGEMPHRWGVHRATVYMFAGVAALSSLPILVLVRMGGKKKGAGA